MDHIHEIVIRGDKSDIEKIKEKISDSFKGMGYEIETSKKKITIRSTEDWGRSVKKHEIDELSIEFPHVFVDCHSVVQGKHTDSFAARLVRFTVSNGETSKTDKLSVRMKQTILKKVQNVRFKRFAFGGLIGLGLFSVLMATLMTM